MKVATANPETASALKFIPAISIAHLKSIEARR